MKISIDRLGKSAEGIGNIDGKTIFVRGALPGETVEISQIAHKKTFATAKLQQVVKPAGDRREVICEQYEKCGGCQTMHMQYQAQLTFKRDQVKDAFVRLAKFDESEVVSVLSDCIASPEEYYYRNKLQVAVQSRAGGQIKAGMFARGSHRIIPIENCHIHHRQGNSALAQILQTLKDEKVPGYNERRHSGYLRHVILRVSETTGSVLVIFVTKTAKQDALKRVAQRLIRHKNVAGVVQNVHTKVSNAILGEKFITIAGEPNLTEEFGDFTFHISPGAFLQVNRAQAERMYEDAVRAAELTGNESCIDAYCGIGTLTLFIAAKAKHVTGIESVDAAVIDAQMNAGKNNITNASFLSGRVEDLLDSLPTADVVFVDPPRKGCAPGFVERVIANAPRGIVYISCEPSSLARDCRLLVDGGYTLRSLTPYDMFPQTSHVETLAVLDRQ